MRVSLDGAGTYGQADGGHRDTSHMLPQGPTHTHTLELRHINASLFFHCDSRGDQARRTQHTGEPEWVPTQVSPLSCKGKPHLWGC